MPVNPVVEKILESLESKKDGAILQFGELVVDDYIAHGQQGIVLKAKSPNGKSFAVKLYAPTDEDPLILKDGRKRFMREASLLLRLRHRNIVNVHACGSARWNADTGWKTTFDFADPGDIPYYVMDYVKGESVKKLFCSRFDKKKGKYIFAASKGTQENLGIFEALIVQVSSAMDFFHSKKIVHRDIKPENIIYSPLDNSFVIVDFGFAKQFKKETSDSFQETILRRPYLDKESEDARMEDKLMDEYFFAEMLSGIFDLFKPRYPARNRRGMEYVLQEARGLRKDRYQSMGEFKKAMELYLHSCPHNNYSFNVGSFLIPASMFGYFHKRIRIPFSGSVPVFDEAIDIIDTKDFQRLKGVSQLGPTNFVFPGANHTRFEHSIGTYFLSLRYLEVLLMIPEFLQEVGNVEEAVKLVVLGALLHDIGHYPYSHWIEEMKGLPHRLKLKRHEDRAKDIILKGEIGEIIRKKWQVDPEMVCCLIQGEQVTARQELLRSIIDSDIDVDKVDYLQRDSAHCGVPYGLALDVDRLITSLWINEKKNRICLLEKGRAPFASLIMSNIVMYQEVYWHKTVRACTAMFKRFFFEVLKKNIVGTKKIKEYLTYTDQEFVETLNKRTKGVKELNKLIFPFANKGRALYKPAYVHYPERGSDPGNTTKFFKTLAEKEDDYAEQITMTQLLTEKLKTHLPQIEEMDIILETAPVKYREVAKLTDFQFCDPKHGIYENVTPEMRRLNDYLAQNRRSYIFCDPKYYEDMRRIAVNGELNEVLGIVNEALGT